MSNALLLAAHRAHAQRGLGADGPWVDPDIFTRDFGSPPSLTSGGNWWSDWGSGLATTVGGTLSSIFGNRNSGSNALQQQAALLAAQQAAAAARNNSSAADDDDDSGDDSFGLKFTDKGLKLGQKTTISYTTLMLAGVAIFLVQSPGFQRRGR